TAQKETAAPTQQESKANYATGTPSPAAGKILDEKGIDAKHVKGTGKDGRITKEDAQKAEALTSKNGGQPSKTAAKPEASASASFGGQRNERREKLSSLRKT